MILSFVHCYVHSRMLASSFVVAKYMEYISIHSALQSSNIIYSVHLSPNPLHRT
jgi:hypothetical protein